MSAAGTSPGHAAFGLGEEQAVLQTRGRLRRLDRALSHRKLRHHARVLVLKDVAVRHVGRIGCGQVTKAQQQLGDAGIHDRRDVPLAAVQLAAGFVSEIFF